MKIKNLFQIGLLSAFLLVGSCSEDYDGRFDELEQKITNLLAQTQGGAALAASITALQAQVTALSTAVGIHNTASASSLAALSTSVAATNTGLAATNAALATTNAGLATTNAGIATTNTNLTNGLAAVNTSLAGVSTANASLAAGLVSLQTQIDAINVQLGLLATGQATAATTAATTAGDQALTTTQLTNAVAALAADVDGLELNLTALLEGSNVVNGDVLITDATLATYQAFGTKLSIVTGKVTVNISTSTAAEVNVVSSLFKVVFGDVSITSNKTLNLSELASVGGNLVLAIKGNLEFPKLTSVIGTVTITDDAATLLVDFEKLATSGIFNSGSVTFAEATSVKLNRGAIASVTANKANVVQLWAANSATGLTISATKAASVITIAGNTLGTGSGSPGQVLSVTGSATSVLNAAAVTKVAALTVTAQTVDFTALASASGRIALTSTTAVSFPALVSAVGTNTDVSGAITVIMSITANSAISFNAPKLVANLASVVPGAGSTEPNALISLAAATTVNVESILTENLVTKGVVTNLTLSDQNAVFSTEGLIKLEAFSSKGKTAAGASTLTLHFANVELVSAAFTGNHGVVMVAGSAGLAKLVTLTTAGTIADLTITGALVLATPTLDHTENASSGAKLTITNNPKLTSFTTKINRVTHFEVTGNTKLASFNASSMVSLPLNSTATGATGLYTITVQGNSSGPGVFATATGLKGTYVSSVGATASSPAIPEQFKQNSLLTLKPYLTVLYTAAFATAPTADKATSKVNIVYLGTSSTPTDPAAGTLTVIATAAGAALGTTDNLKVASIAAQ